MNIKLLLGILFFIICKSGIQAQADFYSLQPLGHRYICSSDYYEEGREIQIYQNGVNGNLKSDSILSIYVFDAQYPPTFNLFCSTFELLYPNTPCIIVGISNPERQHELTPPYTDYNSVKGYDNPGGADTLLLSLKNEIIPFIQEKYHASSNRILVGHSLGGTFVTYAQLQETDYFPCIIAISPNYTYSQRMIIDKLKRLSQTYQSDEKLYIYLAHGYQDATEEKFAPDTKQAKSILQNNNHILVGYDSLSITKHSHTIFEGYYKGLLKSKQYIELSTNR